MSTTIEVGDVKQCQNFWNCKEYMKTVKRVEGENKLCSELCMFVQERAEIEKAYSNNLKKWNNRWSSFLDSGLEYGTGKFLWSSLLQEAMNLSQGHDVSYINCMFLFL